MVVVFFLGLFSMFFAWIEYYGHFRNGLKISFSLIFIFLALRYNYGNDYNAYYAGFLEIGKSNRVEYINNSDHFEVGWIFLNWLFRHLGFFTMTALLALFNCFIYYCFIKKFVPKKYYWLSIFLYIFNPGFMLIHCTAMRQSVAISIFIFSIEYLYNKDAIRYFLCIGMASLFHNSALILLPAYFLGFINLKINKLTGVIFLATFISLFLFQKSLTPYLSMFINTYFRKYEVYQDAAIVGSGLGVLYLSALFILLLYYGGNQKNETALIVYLSIISFMFIPLSLFIEIIGRVGMYFQVATIIAYPIILVSIKNPVQKKIFLTILLFMTSYTFFQFFYSGVYKDAFGTYKTIFSSRRWY